MSSPSILIIEDNDLNQILFKDLLNMEGCKVQVALDAETGIEMARAHRPDLILMDIQLPGMDGLSATKFICNDPDLKSIPVVALTAHAMEGDKDKAFVAGCSGYVTKPVNTRTFYQEVITHLKPESSEPIQSEAFQSYKPGD